MSVKDSERQEAARVTRRFAKNLVGLRRKSGLSQERVATQAGLHRTEISLLEHSRRVPRLSTIVRLAGGIGQEPCELLEGLAWKVDRNRVHVEDEAGHYELAVGSGWEKER
jgi:transcriptional regulator with XRE-family HTH domain